MVIGLSVGPSVSFGEVLKSLDEIRGGNGILALCTNEFWYFVLLNPEIEIGSSITSCWCPSCGGRASGVAGVVVVPVEVDVVIIVVVVDTVPVDVSFNVDLVSSLNCRHC